jgi:PD-(D/E)XK nuclease superfamily
VSAALPYAVEYRPGDSLSPSSHAQYRKCPAQWRYRHIDRLPDPPTGALTQGSAVHAAIGENFRQKIETQRDLPAADVRALYREAWDLLVAGEFPDVFGRPKLPAEFAGDEDAATLKAEGEALAVKYLEEQAWAIHPAAVELPVQGVIGGVPVRGFVDLLDTTGRIIDLKVVKRSPAEDTVSADYRFQVATYRQLCPGASGQARVDSLVKTKTPKLVQQAYTVQPCDLEETQRMYPLVQQAIRTELFLPNRSSYTCSRKYCSFWRACQREFGGEVSIR